MFYLQVSCPEGLISRWGFRQIYRQEMRQQWRDRKYSSHCQSICNRKPSCQTFFTALDVLQLFTLGQHLQTTKSILYEKLWHPMFSRLFCFDVWFWFNAGIRRACARFWREISNRRNTNFTGNGKITVQEFPALFFSIKTYSLDKANNLRAASAVKKVVKTLFPISRTCLSSGLIPWCSAAKKAVFKMIHMVTADSKSMSWVTRNMKFWNLTHGW